jgi:hypothetical protein
MNFQQNKAINNHYLRASKPPKDMKLLQTSVGLHPKEHRTNKKQ